jgi:hypothetical protein
MSSGVLVSPLGNGNYAVCVAAGWHVSPTCAATTLKNICGLLGRMNGRQLLSGLSVKGWHSTWVMCSFAWAASCSRFNLMACVGKAS